MNYLKYTSVDVANYIVKKTNEFNARVDFQEQISLRNRRLQLLIYFCEIEYMKKNNGIPLFTDYYCDFLAWPNGPTITAIVLKFAQQETVEMNLCEPVVELPDNIKSIINEVLEATKNIDTLDLIEISNVIGGPWHQAYNEKNWKYSKIISKKEMYCYYLNKELFKRKEEINDTSHPNKDDCIMPQQSIKIKSRRM